MNRIMSTIVHFVGAFLGVESFGIGYFDTVFTLDIFDNVYRVI